MSVKLDGGLERGFMSCPSCGSDSQTEFRAEMIIHFMGIKYLDNPGVFAFPTLLVCMECGHMDSIVPESELALLVSGTASLTA
jgi:uncharacterized Zn finger protein